jgi:hypothetical protein
MIDTYEEIHVKTESMAGHRNREGNVVPVVGLGVVASRVNGVDIRGSNSRLGNPIHSFLMQNQIPLIILSDRSFESGKTYPLRRTRKIEMDQVTSPHFQASALFAAGRETKNVINCTGYQNEVPSQFGLPS